MSEASEISLIRLIQIAWVADTDDNHGTDDGTGCDHIKMSVSIHLAHHTLRQGCHAHIKETSLLLLKTDMGQFSAKRFQQLTLNELPDGSKGLANEILAISSLGLAGPYNVMLRSPIFADRIKRLLDYLRFDTSLPLRLNEFAILIQAKLWTSSVEWCAHYPIAMKAGLPASIADDLKAGIRPRDMKEDEEVVYDVCMTLSKEHEISDELFDRAVAILGEQQLVDLIAVSGTYITIAMLLSLGEEPVPEGKPIPFPEKSRTRRRH